MADIINKIDSLVSSVLNRPFDVKNISVCGTTQYEAEQDRLNPSRIQSKAALENAIQGRISQKKTPSVSSNPEPKVISVVVHVVYNSDRENISDDQIKSQIDVLNQDFSRTNSDANNTPNAFKPVATDTGIRFCLVKAIRKQTNVKSFSSNNDVKFTSKGGSDAEDVTKYLNIWVCNLRQSVGNGGVLLGYTELPMSTPSNTYGSVIHNESFGIGGITRPPYNMGRTCTHEIAHALNVLHVFDESTQACVKTDKVNDIPTQSQATFGCPSFPKTDNCSLNSPGIMFMNFMDYSNDDCRNCFTKGQADRMHATIEAGPYTGIINTQCPSPVSSTYPLNTKLAERKGFKTVIIILIIAIVAYFLFKQFSKNNN